MLSDILAGECTMIFYLILGLILMIFTVVLLPVSIITMIELPSITAAASSVWLLIAGFWLHFSSEWILNAFHAKPFLANKRIVSFVKLENFYDKNPNFSHPNIYLQTFSSNNPVLFFSSMSSRYFLFSEDFFYKLSHESLFSVIQVLEGRFLGLPFWLAGKVLALRLLFLQFFSMLYSQVFKIKGKFMSTLVRYSILSLCYLTSPIFIGLGFIYSKIWSCVLLSSYKKGLLAEEVFQKLSPVFEEQSKNSMSFLGYLIGTGHGDVKAHPMVHL